MTDEAKALNVYQRINLCREEVTYVRKDKEVSTGAGGGKYKAVTHDAVVATARKSLIKNGVIVVPSLISEEFEPQGQKWSAEAKQLIPSSMRIYKAIYDISFINEDKPDDKLTLRFSAHGQDTGDKGPGKAVTYATKAAILKVLLLETGEDEEGRLEQGITLDETEVEEITERLAALKFDDNAKKNFWSYVSGLAKTPIHDVANIPVKIIPDVKLMLTAKERQVKNKAKKKEAE